VRANGAGRPEKLPLLYAAVPTAATRFARKRKCTVRTIPKKQCQQGLWILKPSSLNRGAQSLCSPLHSCAVLTGGAAGRGIQVFSTTAALVEWLQEHGAGHQWVVQKYLERPLLIRKRKFDIRMYALIRFPYDVYFYRDGACARMDCGTGGLADAAQATSARRQRSLR
jgi:hypothetical protein